MPIHPLRDLGWKIHRLLERPDVREKFISQCGRHLADLRDLVIRGPIAKLYGQDLNSGRKGSQQYPDTSLGWLTAHDDENVTLQEEYAILCALRECVYKGRDRLSELIKTAMPRRATNEKAKQFIWDESPPPSPQLSTDFPVGIDLQKIYVSDGGYWSRFVAAVNGGLTEEHRGHVDSWLRDVRLDLKEQQIHWMRAEKKVGSEQTVREAGPSLPPGRASQPTSRPNPGGTDTERPQETDGPFGTSGFRFRGVEVRFGRAAMQRKLVLALWDQAEGSPRPARLIEDVIEEVYGADHDTQDSTFRQLCSDTRKQFERTNCPLQIDNLQGTVQLIPYPL